MVSKDIVFQQIVSLIANAHQLHYDLTKDMQMQDLTPLQYEILELLYMEQPMMVSRISECKGISLPNMSREIKKLTEKGYCEKIIDSMDRRKQYIRLTSQGEERMTEAFNHMKNQIFQSWRGITDDELLTISEALRTVEAFIVRTES